MPKSTIISKSPPLSQLRRPPYRRRAADTAASGHALQQSTIIPLEEIQCGHFYNCSISFTPVGRGRRVPRTIPKHRVLVKEVDTTAGERLVEIFYLTTFSGSTPSAFHGSRNDKRRMYLPMEPHAHLGYLSLASSPPLMCGWLNFARPMLVRYTDDLPSARKLRRAPESVGATIPLRHAAIVLPDWALEYTTQMCYAWKDTINSTALGRQREWPARAKRLHDTFIARKNSEQGMARSRPEDEGEDGEEWAGITDVCSRPTTWGRLSHTDFLQLFDGSCDDGEAEDGTYNLTEIEPSLAGPGFGTPNRHAGGMPLAPPNTGPRAPYLTTQQVVQPVLAAPGITAPSTSPCGALPLHAYVADEPNVQNSGRIGRTYDAYTAIAMFWNIVPGEEDIDPPADLYSTVLGGRPMPCMFLE